MSILDSIATEAPVVNNNAPADTKQQPAETATAETAETTTTATEENSSQENITDTTNTAEQPNAPDVATTETQAPENPFANEEVAKFNDFVKRTGKGYDDYKALNTPTSELDSKELLRQYYSEKEGMGEKQIALKMKQLELAEQTVDEDDDFGQDESPEQLKAQAEIESDLNKASEWREAHVKELLSTTATQTSEQADQQPTVEQFLQNLEEQQKLSREEYHQTMYNVLPDIKAIELDILGQKISYTPDEEFAKNMRVVIEDLSIGVMPFFENGKVSKPKELATEAGWAYKPTRDAMLKFIVDQAITIDRAGQMRERRNVSTDNYQNQASTGDIDKEAAFDQARASRK